MSIPSSLTEIILAKKAGKGVNLNFGEESSTFKISKYSFKEDDVEDGQVLVKVIYLSNDPSQRVYIQKGVVAERMYAPLVEEGEPMQSLGVGEVIFSKSATYKVGDKLIASLGWRDYAILGNSDILNKIDESLQLPLPVYLSTLGLTGMTAYFGVKEIGQLKQGQTIVVSAASGSTGSIVVQLAKNLFGAKKVIGISGSDEKCRWVESIGADKCVNYNDPNFHDKLSKAIGNEYADVYFDNVGGKILSFMLTKVKRYGRVVACGAVAGYDNLSEGSVNNWGEIITNRLTVQGFICFDFAAKYPEAIRDISAALKTGKLAADSYTVVDISHEKNKFEQIPQVWNKLFTAKGNGKLLTKL